MLALGSSIRAPSGPRDPRKPGKSPIFPRSISERNWTCFSNPRNGRQRAHYVNVVDCLVKQSGQTAALAKHCAEYRNLEDCCCTMTMDSKELDCSLDQIDLAHEVNGLIKETISSGYRTNDGISQLDISNGLKFAFFCGLFAFQGASQAVAETELAGQSIGYLGDLGDISTGFASAFLLIFFSELGDKTFFIAALLAARNSAAVIFIGTFGALAAMTIVSVIIGRTFHYVDGILPFRLGETDLPVDDIAAVGLLFYFGISTLLEASSGDDLKMKEEQKEAELAISGIRGNGAGILAVASTVISTFVLVFVAEWALAAASSPLGVVGGAVAGHAVATLLAVVGGSLLGTFLSEKVIAYIGGVLFLVFAVATLVEIVS